MTLRLQIVIGCMLLWGLGCQTEREQMHRRLPAVDSLLQNEIELGHLPGAVVQVKKGDSILHRGAYGFARKFDYELQLLENPEPMTTRHLFDLASLTKVCATTFGIMMLVDRGAIQLDEPIHQYLPEFNKGAKAKITVRHLLTHTAGLPQWVPAYYHASNREQRYRYLTELPLKWKVGEGRHYSDLGFMLLGDIIEKVTRRSLERFLEEELFEPLSLRHTAFNPLAKGYDRIAATSHGNPFEKRMIYDDDFGYQVEADPRSWNRWRQYTLHGEVNDGNAWYANGGVAGHAGLFSTVGDLQKLVDLLLDKGWSRGRKLIAPGIIDRFLSRDRYGNGLGWAMDPGIFSADGAPPGTFGHTGFTGTSVVVVPQDSLSIILLTNRQNAGTLKNGYYYDLGPLRQALYDKVQAAASGNL